MSAARVWVALLRGINVGSSHRVSMVDLRAAVAAAGGTEVSTHIQSGNVLLCHRTRDRAKLTTTLEETLAAELGFPVPVVLRSGDELADLLARCPFTGADWDADRRRYVSFLSRPPARELLDRLRAADHGGSSMYVTPTEVCVSLVPSAKPGYTDVDRLLKVPSTARAWNVVEKLVTLATRH
jgi:uncharacterized protein (DUF1697 family)